MARVATKLTPANDGGWIARKRIPEDVQAAYEPLYGVRWEERLRLPPIPIHLARAKHRDWLTEIESRVVNLRAVRTGAGRSLMPKDARALAGEWYHWFTERHIEDARTAAHWEDLRDKINDALTDHLDPWRDPNDRDRQELDDVWQHTLEAREAVRAMHADWCETSQFLAVRRMVLDAPSRDLFLDHLYGDFGEALRLLIKRAGGDYTADTHPLQFPKFSNGADAGLTPWKLFDRYVTEKRPADGTVARWRGVFLNLEAAFSGHSAASITKEEAQDWASNLGNSERTPTTVKNVWVRATRTVFAWGVKHKVVPANPFTSVEIAVPRVNRTRAQKAFNTEEATTILQAANAVTNTTRASGAARRWVLWVCAYTGARVGEITQLRGEDVIKLDGIDAIRITPEAGTVKNRQTREVPIHEHLIAEGFLTFVASRGKGPLFNNVAKGPLRVSVATNPSKARYVKTREHLAEWVRGLGVNDPEVRPNHAWRHTFKQVAARSDISDRMSDYITGHAPATVARGYGAPTIGDMAEALKKFPRYEV